RPAPAASNRRSPPGHAIPPRVPGWRRVWPCHGPAAPATPATGGCLLDRQAARAAPLRPALLPPRRRPAVAAPAAPRPDHAGILHMSNAQLPPLWVPPLIPAAPAGG